MPKFAANLSMLFTELPFLDRFAAAAAVGFKAVEYMFPYEFEPHVLAERLQTNGLQQVLHNLPPGNWAAGERGIACLSDRVGEFQDGVGRAIEYATALNCPRLNCMAGLRPEGVSAASAEDVLVSNLSFAARELRKAGLTLLLEAINTFDMPGFLVCTTRQALAILDAVAADNLLYQYDIYHMQRMEGELAATIEKNLARIGHIQIAGNPGRHEPDIGEINYPFLIERLDALGYSGWIGAEYKPRGKTEDGLGWMRTYGSKG
jgi:hydroxypyruvate isomerase